jgi:molybdopterin molybdotransferase
MSDFPTGLLFDDALALLARVADNHRLPAERLATARTHGRVLAADVVAPIDLPAFDNSAMDGFAFRHADAGGDGMVALRLLGEQFAGRDLGLRVAPGECVRITTGAPMPAGADTVAIQENVAVDDDRVRIPANTPAGANVRRAGEDVRAGTRVLERGNVLTPARVAIAASLGIDQLEVSSRPTVAVFTTGDELVEPGMPLRPGEIYNSNRELLLGLLRAEGLEPTAWPTLPDDPQRVRASLLDAASSFDLVLTCGAVSAGAKDHIPALLQEHGRVHFWKVRMKPGMPALCGELDRALFLGLPGNPVSVLATWLTLGRALVDGMQGRTEARRSLRARLAAPIDKPHARREFMRGHLANADDGVLQVEPDAATGSHRLLAAARSDALIVVGEGAMQLPVGSIVDVLPY